MAVSLAIVGLVPAAHVAAGPADGFSSPNIEFVRNLPFEAGTAAAARLHGDRLYLTSYKHLSIFDVSDPLDPISLSSTPTGINASNEDVDTNGRILLISEQVPLGRLHVWDVEDPTAPSEIAILDNAGEHTVTCLFDCRFAYGSEGAVIDLRDPARPQVIGNWLQGLPPPRGFGVHDVTEVRPGIVLTSSSPVMLLDARKDPAQPRLVAVGDEPLPGIFHSNAWPRGGRDRFFLLSTEGNTTAGICDSTAGVFSVWDTHGYREGHTFRVLDSFALTNGTMVDGNGAYGLGCSAHWFDPHPAFDRGGPVVMAGYRHGVRLLDVARTGQISETGYFLGHGADTWAALWVSPEVIYAIDFTRGIDVLRYVPEA